MGFTWRKSIKLGPIRWNFGRTGYTSTTYRLGPWSYNTRTRAQRVDLPGPLSWRGRKRS